MCTSPVYIKNINSTCRLSNNSFHYFMRRNVEVLDLIQLWNNNINNIIFNHAEFSSFWYQPWQEYFLFHYNRFITIEPFLLNEWRRALYLSFCMKAFDFLYTCDDFHHSFVLPVYKECSKSAIYSVHTFIHVLEKETYTLSIFDK